MRPLAAAAQRLTYLGVCYKQKETFGHLSRVQVSKDEFVLSDYQVCVCLCVRKTERARQQGRVRPDLLGGM